MGEMGPEAQWDAIPASAKWQILTVIGALEIWDEASGGKQGQGEHYMKGGQPGNYPSFQLFRDNVPFVLDLYDPFGFNKKMSQENKDRRLVAEINNGRLRLSSKDFRMMEVSLRFSEFAGAFLPM